MPVAITEKSLRTFSQWLLDRGRSDGTSRVYVSSLRQCADAPSLTSRLIDKDLAPKTRRTSLAALAAWAHFTDDMRLTKLLKEIRLPPSVRVRPKIPMTTPQWKKFVEVTKGAKFIDAPMKVVILIMALRGLRIGDALRIRRREVGDAIRTGKLSFEGKGRKRHEIAARPIKAELAEVYAIGNWDRMRELFGSRWRKITNERSVDNKISRAVKKIAKKAGVDGMHPHRLRRTHATMFLERIGNDPQALIKLQNYMGWSNLATAASYVDAVSKSELDQIGADLVEDLLS